MTATILHLPVRTQPAHTPPGSATETEIQWLFLPMFFYVAWWSAGMKLLAARM